MDPRQSVGNLKETFSLLSQNTRVTVLCQDGNNEKKFIWQWYGNSFFSLEKKNKIVILGLMGICLEQKEIVSQALAK